MSRKVKDMVMRGIWTSLLFGVGPTLPLYVYLYQDLIKAIL